MFRRIKRLLRLRNKSGFTMTEVIIACALLGILVLGIMGFVTPILSSVRAKEQNARAVLLSEAIDTYIANTIQYSYHVAVVDYASAADTRANDTRSDRKPNVYFTTYTGTEFKSKDEGLSDLMGRVSGEYEVRCIGVRWLDVPGERIKKLMLTNEKVDQATGALDEDGWIEVFDSIFYDGLYPVFRFKNYGLYENPYYDETKDPEKTGLDSDGRYRYINPAYNESTDPDKDGIDADGDRKYITTIDEKYMEIAPGLKIVTDIYTTPECYNIIENVRDDAMLTFSGMAFANLPNIKSRLLNNGSNKICPTISVNSYDDAYSAYMADTAYTTAQKEYKDDRGNEYYYPNSFIYYLVKK